ncbi:hypothetical protein HNR60_003716 [Rhodopseudomonas rhenobacensis]|uniref:Fibronectin type III domain-containing protein n=1 Tax=Rhodopseudomonas rhenobacensis TaxID=87461 RepID=A0A7W7Z6Y9_9BRAD|nr:IPT/TIG domain-containing protein [Rhodopseudomonas rhenobacensis]MBB5048945.1 hypothetical protein [Rhodopseudomonas rhenobacensis]
MRRVSIAARLGRVAALAIGLTVTVFGTSMANAACETSVDFTGAALNDTRTLDVSDCSEAVRAGLYTTNGFDSQIDAPMYDNNSDGNPVAASIGGGNGAIFLVTPISVGDGLTFNGYTIKLTTLGTSTSGSIPVYYASQSCPISANCQYLIDTGFYYAITDTTYTISVTNMPSLAPGAPTIGTATAGDAQATVTFTPPSSVGGSPITSYTVTSSPGSITATGPASPITVTGLTNGTAYTFTVTATNSNATGPASAASNSVTPKAAQTITFAQPGAQNFGTSPTLSASATSSLPVTFTSSTTGVCTISTGGTLTFVTAGTCTINADQAGDASYQAAPTVTRSLAVNAVVPGAPTIGTATAGDAQATVTFTAPASNGGSAITDYTVTSSPGGFTGSGGASPITVTGLTNGIAYTFTVIATNSAGTGADSAASNSVTPKAAQTITFAPPGAQTFGTSPTLSASATSSLAVTFSSTTTGVCTVTPSGTLTFVTAGTCTINADQAGDGTYLAAPTVSQSFAVNAIAPGAPTIGTATPGDAQATVTFTAPASNGGSAITGYTVTSSPGGFTGSGGASPITVTGLTNGIAYTFTVTATNSAGTGAASAASNSVTPKAAQTITFAQPGAQTFGTSPTLSASATSSLAVTFSSTTTGVCTVTPSGTLTFVTAGTCTINADQAGDTSYQAAPTVTRSFAVNAIVPGAPTIGTATPGDAQATVTFTAPASNGGSAITGYTVTSSPGGFTGSGGASPITVTGLTNGIAYTFTVTATNSAGTGAASAASNSVTPKAAQTITFAQPGAQTFGTSPTLSASATSSLPVTFTSSTTGVCTITSGGTLTFVTAGNCTINADQAGNGAYQAATTVTRSFAVNAVVPGAPTIGTATAGNGQATVTFSPPASNGGAAITSYTVTSSPGGITATGPASPITVTGLANLTAYTFTVTATNSAGTGAASAPSNSVTPLPDAPTVTAISPAAGPLSGGTAVTITGSNFIGPTAVTIGGSAATGVTVVNATTITATTPAHAAGTVDVAVTTSGGTGTGVGLYTYAATPTVASIAPNAGPISGGTNVTITGTNFTGASTVTIGGAAATAITVVSATTITATTPSHAAGTVDVVVTTPGGTGTGVGLYTYAASPTVASIAPNAGPISGGTNVTITGNNFTGPAVVTIGGSAATGVTVVNATTITATTPAHAAGTVDVAVTTSGGTGTGVGLYTYAATPTVASIAPNTGPISGGSNVTITGTNFTGATAVSIGGSPATGVTVVSATTITAITPAHTAGTVDVAVTTPGGTGTGAGLYTYAGTPTVAAISPSAGPTAGGTAVTITGSNFTGATAVSIGGSAATGFAVVNSTTITATTPAHAAGTVDVAVTTPGGTGTGAGLYTYNAVPVVTAIAPTSGPAAGGTAVTITGSNFTGATAVTIGGTAATGVTVVSATTITATTPAHAAGVVSVAVTTPGGTGTGAGLYTYAAPPTVTSIAPNSGSINGGTAVTITGSNFTGATAVTIGGAAATGVTVVSATTITATTPAHAAGVVDVAVTTPVGTGTGAGLYTYAGAPTVTSISPNSGSIAGGTTVTITGSNFIGVTGVTFGGIAASSFTVVNPTTITAVVPPHGAGPVDVAVITSSGSGSSGPGAFVYAPQPSVASVSPSSGPSSGGTAVTITGSNFIGVTGVSFGGAAATAVTVVSATSLTATTPAHAAGAVDIAVTSPSGTGTGSQLFSYVVPATTTSLSSSRNPSEAGQAVTFTATVNAGGVTPTGTVTFNDGGVAIGSAILSGGTAALTTSALTIGTHSITAVFAGNANFAGSTSSPLLQAVNTPQDSLKLRALQIMATKTIAQSSGAAISGAIDSAISEGFANGGQLLTPSGSGLRFNFTDDPDQMGPASAETTVSKRWNGSYGTTAETAGIGASNGGRGAGRGKSRVDDAFAAIDRDTMKTKAPARQLVEPKDWLLWAEVKGASIGQWNSNNTVSALYGDQVNALIGLTRKVSTNVLVGVVGGYETFDYRSDTLNGRLKGDGWTLGSYAAWKFAAGLRLDAAAAYSGIGYDGAAGAANGTFDGRRWLVSGGLTGTTELYGFAIEPSARVYALWERENAYTDSLGTLQAERDFFTGRASGGLNASYPWLYSATVTLAPYAGLYADYYFTGDDAAAVALAGTAPLASVPLLDGWSARVTGGLAARFGNGAAVALGAELGGLGGTVQIWTLRGRASIPF